MDKSHKPRILLVEDDQNFGDVLKNYLEIHDFEVDRAKDGIEGFAKFKSGKYDLIIMDVMLPRRDGFTVANDIRKTDSEIPIIFLTAKTLREDIIKGFQVGGDDYITKPFDTEELLLRIQAVLRRTLHIDDEPVETRFDIGKHFHFDAETRELTYRKDGHTEKLRLSRKEAQLLHLFCLKKGQVVLRKDALRRIWGEDNYFTARSMDVYISRLRKLLSRDPSLCIENIHGDGFRLLESC